MKKKDNLELLIDKLEESLISQSILGTLQLGMALKVIKDHTDDMDRDIHFRCGDILHTLFEK